MANVMTAIVLMVAGIIVLGMGSVILTGDTVSDYYDNVEALDTNTNVSQLYILFLEFLPFAIVLGIFAVLIGVGLAELGVLGKLGI